MRILFIDEAGCSGSLPPSGAKIQPALCIAGLVIGSDRVTEVTRAWIDLKKRFYPGLCGPCARPWDWQRAEVKGSELRAAAAGSDRRGRRHAIGFLDRTIELLYRSDVRLVARCWIKAPGETFNGDAVYTFSVQAMCASFGHLLSAEDSRGIVIADSRLPRPNSRVAHSIFTQKYRLAGDVHPRMVEVPLFGHSDNHAGLQLADIVASALLFPICVHFFLEGKIQNIHLRPGYHLLAERYCPSLRLMQYRHGPNHRRAGGIVVSDKQGRRGATHLFARYGPGEWLPRGLDSPPTHPDSSPPARGPR